MVVALTALFLLIVSASAAGADDEESILVTPAEATLRVGESVRLSAEGVGFPLVDPHWKTDPAYGTITVDPDDPTTCTFTAAAPGSISVIVTEGGTSTGGSYGYATVTITPGGQTLAHIEVSPADVSIDIGETHQFSATGYDVNGEPVSPPITPTWSTDGGTITSDGTYTAPDTPGDYTVTATDQATGTAAAAAVAVGNGGGGSRVAAILASLGVIGIATALAWGSRKHRSSESG